MTEKIKIPLHVISLRSRRERCYAQHESFLHSKFEQVHEFRAIDHTQIDVCNDSVVHPLVAVNIGKLNVDHTLNTVGGIGCYLSHVELWRHCARESQPMLILEDDIEMEYYFETLQPYFRDLECVPDGTLASLMHAMRDRRKNANSVIMAPLTDSTLWCDHEPRDRFTGTMMYYVTPSAAASLLRCALPLFLHVDVYIGIVATSTMLSKRSMPTNRSAVDAASTSGDSNPNRLHDASNPRPDFRVIVARNCIYRFGHYIRDHMKTSIHNNISFKHILPENNWIYCAMVMSLIIFVCLFAWRLRRNCQRKCITNV